MADGLEVGPKSPLGEPRQPAEPQQPAHVRQTPPEEPPEEPPSATSGRKVWILAAVIAVGLGAAFYAWRYYSVRETTDDAQIAAHIAPVSARVSGYITAVNVDNNRYVEAGAILVQIDPRDYQVAVEKARADLAAAESAAHAARTHIPITTTTTSSQLHIAQAGVHEAEAGVESSRQQVDAALARVKQAAASLRQAEANYVKADSDRQRYQQLVAKDEVSQQLYQTAVTAAEAQRARVDAARSGVAEAEQEVSVARAHVVQAEAKVRQAEANVAAASSAPQQVQVSRQRSSEAGALVEQKKAALAQAELNLQYTTVRAPVNGIIGKRNAELGQNISPGQPLMAITRMDDIWATANFKETQMNHMRPGQKANISVDAYGGRDYAGYVESIAGATGATFSLLPPENASGNFVKVVQRIPVRVRLNQGQNSEHVLRPGMSVEVTVFTQ
ncbi:MAG: HlyD family secretion protein [Bryobacterales bacterium]|nr:HlyD family secretion protein [Bryobacterales bacterium]